ncbi:MAG: E3 binding domain-containing protein, partial [Sphingomonadales bacterium]|nr:E3 binding domain-containing protein [Sphingomonadales bacterium]
MAEDIKVPTLGESITEATIGRWLKQVGEAVAEDEPIVELETDKVAMEVNAPVSGVMAEIISAEGDTVEVGAVIAKVDISGKAPTVASAPKAAPSAEPAAAPAPATAPAPAAPVASQPQMPMSPAVRKLVGEHNLDAGKIAGTGKDGRITKGDVLKAVAAGNAALTAPAQGAVAAVDAGPRQERV